MKTKGIPIWEQHLEHLVVGVAVLILIAFAAMQFMGSPNSVDVPGTGKVAPGDIDKLLETKAVAISQTIAGPAVSIPDPNPILKDFEKLRTASISPQPTLLAMAPSITPAGGSAIGPENRAFVIPVIAAPYDIATQQYFETLSEETVSEHTDLKSVLPPAAPYDISWITASVMFDFGAVKKQFSEPGPNGEAPLPAKWTERVDFIDVKFEREELVGGKWEKSNLLTPIPGQVTVRPRLAGRIDSAAREEILWTISQGRTSLIQPEFYSGSAAAWAPPNKETNVKVDAESSANPDAKKLADLQARLKRKLAEVDRISEKMKEASCPEEAPPEAPAPPKPGGAKPPKGGAPAPGPGAGAGFGESSGKGVRDPNKGSETECKKMRATLNRLKKQVAETQAAIDKLTPATPEKTDAPVVVVPEAVKDVLQIWAHDITVQPGKTYRYRATIEIYNPLFARKLDLIPAQQNMAEKFTLASMASEWSAPILAEPPLRFFITSAKSASQSTAVVGPGTGLAGVEVYRYRDGRWWSDTFSVGPGQRIGGVRNGAKGSDKPIDFGTDWFLLDIIPDNTPEEADLGRSWGAATVVLQSLSDDSLMQQRIPRVDYTSPNRSYLNGEAKSAEEEVAAAPATPAK